MVLLTDNNCNILVHGCELVFICKLWYNYNNYVINDIDLLFGGRDYAGYSYACVLYDHRLF